MVQQQHDEYAVVEINREDGVYSVCDRLWAVGPRYKLHEHIGAGSYGEVCRATDAETLEIVALKRIPDVFLCHMLAKRVLREVCIMRRLRHPYIIALQNVFTSPNLEIEGGVDLYIATEYASSGDLYHLRRPLQGDQVQLLIWQLLTSVGYLHSCNVWHRDIKSENVLLSSGMDIKICDFGLSRSAMESLPSAEPRQAPTTGRRSSSRKPVLLRQYTKTVVTPSYRAPEVIMSQGQYSSAIDIWAVGCIFWELLSRQLYSPHVGPPPRPLFGMRGEPNTPLGGELYTEDGHSKLSEQLNVIFDVIGTPCWKDIESVPGESWRAYLKQVPGRAGNLVLNLAGVIDEEALDLLSRMLAFDPAHRCTAEEALAHTYLKNLQQPQNIPTAAFGNTSSNLQEDEVWLTSDPAAALGLLERQLEASMSEEDGGREMLEWLLQREVEGQQKQLLIKTAAIENIRAGASAGTATTNVIMEDRSNSSSVLQLFPVSTAAATAQVAPVSILANVAADRSGVMPVLFSNVDPVTAAAARGGGLTLSEVQVPQVSAAAFNNTTEDRPPVKKGRKKIVIKHGSSQVEAGAGSRSSAVPSNSTSAAPSTRPSRPATKRKIENGYDELPVTEMLPRRSPRLRDTHAQGELPHRKRVTLRG